MFSQFSVLPFLILLGQWIIIICLLAIEYEKHRESDICPMQATPVYKLLYIAISCVYYVRSFGLWDQFMQLQSTEDKMAPKCFAACLDTLNECFMQIMIFAINLFIIYIENDSVNLVLNTLALEWVSSLDNDFENLLYDQTPSLAVYIYDHVFVDAAFVRENQPSHSSRCSRCVMRLLQIIHMCLQLAYIALPAAVLFALVAGGICK